MSNGFETLSTVWGIFESYLKVDLKLSPSKLNYEITFNVQRKI